MELPESPPSQTTSDKDEVLTGVQLPAPDDENDEQEEQFEHNRSTHSERPHLLRRAGGRRVITGLAKNWVSPHNELAQVEKRHGKVSWQAKALRVIHSQRFQHILMAALLLDVLILFAEIYLYAEYPLCFLVERDAISCCTESGDKAEGDHRWLAFEEDHHQICDAPLVDTNYPAACDPHKWEGVHTAHEVLFFMTVAILSVFFVELVVLLAVLGLKLFFHNRLYVLDLVIVVSSLTLEITFYCLEEEDLATLTGLLILGRVWRFVRIGHGLFATTLEVSLHKVEELENQVAELKFLLEESSGVKQGESSHSHH